jgi:hypothetical protein
MPLHLLPIEPPPVSLEELQEIRLPPGDHKARPPRLRDWESRPDDQTLVHVQSGCRFVALRLERPLIEGLRVPFADYDIGVRFVGMDGERLMPSPEEIRVLGQHGIAWILTYTFESRRRAVR